MSPKKLRERFPPSPEVIRERERDLREGMGLKEVTREKYDRAYVSFKSVIKGLTGTRINKHNAEMILGENVLVKYATYESMFMSCKSLKSKISAIKHCLLNEYGLDPWEKLDKGGRYRFGALLREIGLQDKERGKGTRVKLAITKDIVNRIARRVDRRDREEMAYVTLFAVGVAGLMRWSELAVDGRDKRMKKLLTFRHIEFLKGKRGIRGKLSIPDPKTLRHKGNQTVYICEDGSDSCPVRLLYEYLCLLPGKSRRRESPLFQDREGKPLVLVKTKRRMKRWLGVLGISLKSNRGMSLRRGGALSLALVGTPDRVIQEMGRWSSYCYRLYIDLTDLEKQKWLERVGMGKVEYGPGWKNRHKRKRGERDREQIVISGLEAICWEEVGKEVRRNLPESIDGKDERVGSSTTNECPQRLDWASWIRTPMEKVPGTHEINGIDRDPMSDVPVCTYDPLDGLPRIYDHDFDVD